MTSFSVAYANGREILVFIETIDDVIEVEESLVFEPEDLTIRTVFMPGFSYRLISFNDLQFHNIQSGLTVTRFSLPERDRILSVSLFYSPSIINEIYPSYPNLFHNAGALIFYRLNQHRVNAAFMARSDKPLYGGLDTFAGFAGYSNEIVNGEHFSLALGLNLAVINFGIELSNGVPWLLWPLPVINIGWVYEWFTFNISSLPPMVRFVLAPQHPISLEASMRVTNFDIAIWFRRFRNENPSFELFGIGAGIKRETNMVSFANEGRRYGINYNALYGSIRILRLFELSGGWVFNGVEGYGDRNLSTADFDGNIGRGFFVSLSARMLF